MRDTSSTFDDTSAASDDTSDVSIETTENTTENPDSYGKISTYYNPSKEPKKKIPGFERYAPQMPIGTFVIKNTQSPPSQADILLHNRIGTGKGPRVGGELKENQTFQARALELAKLTEIGRAATAAGFELYTNVKGEPVFKIPQEYQDSISQRATENLAAEIKKQTKERFEILYTYIAQAAAIESRGDSAGVATKKFAPTIKRLIDGANNEESNDGFNDALSVIEGNIAALEELVTEKETTNKSKANDLRKEQEAIAKNLESVISEKAELATQLEVITKETEAKIQSIETAANDRIAAVEKEAANTIAAKEKESADQIAAMQRELDSMKSLIREFSVTLFSFSKTAAEADTLIPSLTDKVAQDALLGGMQEINQIIHSFSENPSSESVTSLNQKSTSFASFVESLQQKYIVTIPKTEEATPATATTSQEKPTYFGIMDGWPSSIKQEKREDGTPEWVYVGENNAKTPLINNAFWSTLRREYDEVFSQYQDFFTDPNKADSERKVREYGSLTKCKNDVTLALLELNYDNAQSLINHFKEALHVAGDSWAAVLQERENQRIKKEEQKKLLDRLNDYSERVTKIEETRKSLASYQGTEEQRDTLKNALEYITNKQQETKNLIISQKPLTKELVDEYRDGIDIVDGLLVTLKKDKDAFDAEQKKEQDRLFALFQETSIQFERITQQEKAFLFDISSPTELSMIEGRYKDIAQEREKIQRAISGATPITEEMIKLHTKHLQDFDSMLSRVENRLRASSAPLVKKTEHTQDKGHTPERTLLPNGKLVTLESEKRSASPTQQFAEGIEARSSNPLLKEYEQWADRDFAGFVKWYKKQEWKDGDTNKYAAEKIIKAHINALTVKKSELEKRKEGYMLRSKNEEDTQNTKLTIRALDALNIEIAEVDNEINYLTQQKVTTEEPSAEVENIETKNEKTSSVRPFTNRLKSTSISSEIRRVGQSEGEQVPMATTHSPQETKAEKLEVFTPKAHKVISVETKTEVQEEKQEEVAKSEPKEENNFSSIKTQEEITPSETADTTSNNENRKNAVTKLLFTRQGTGTNILHRIIAPIPLRTNGNSTVSEQSPKIPETLASTTSWKDFLQTENLITFAEKLVSKKVGFLAMIKDYAPSVHIDNKNPASASAIATMKVYTLIHSEEGVYGLDETKRKELSDIVLYLDTIIRATESQKTISSTLQGQAFSSLTPQENFESLYARALKEAEQATLAEQRDKMRRESLYKKTV